MLITLAASVALVSAAHGAELPVRGSGWLQPHRGLPLLDAFQVPPTRHNGEVWAFAAERDGQLWIGSDELFLFDGRNRERVALPFETYAVRALARDADGRLWVGAIGEIGHLEPTPTGGWTYVSARADLQAAGVGDLRDVWRAHLTPEGVVFVADQQVLRWTGRQFERWMLQSTPNLLSNEDGGTLWIFQSGAGLLRMEKAGPRVVVAQADLPSAIVFWTLTVPDRVAAEELLVGTPDGVFLGRACDWRKLEAVSAAVAGKFPLHAAAIARDSFAIGTYLGGVVLASADDQLLMVLDRSGGLPNESITGLWFDGRKYLWVGYPGGMARIEAHAAGSVFESGNGLNEAPVLKVLAHEEDTYVLSRRMLAKLTPARQGRPAIATQVLHLPVPLSDAISLGDTLWLSGYGGGIWRALGDQPVEAVGSTGYIFGLLPAENTPFSLFFLRNTQIEALRATGVSGWRSESLHADVDAYPVNALCDPNGDVWVSTVTRGVFRFRLDSGSADAPRLRLVKHYREGEGLPHSIERPQLTMVGQRIFLHSENEILTRGVSADAFEMVHGLEQFTPLAATATDHPSTAYWLMRQRSSGTVSSPAPVLVRVRSTESAEAVSCEPLEAPGLAQAGRINGLSFTPDDGGALWVAGSRALVRLSVAQLGPLEPPPALLLRRIERNGVPIALPQAGAALPFDAETTRLRFELAGAVRATGEPLLVQASLRGLSEEWQQPQAEPSFDFTGLRPGAYTFGARAVDAFGRVGPTLAFGFTVAAPWYLRGLAIAGYVLAGLLLVAGGVRWRLRHLRRQNERLNRIVDERTRELAHANMVKNEFLENISHEIRNPLNGIANLVDLLHDAPLQPEQRRLAQSLGRSTEHLKRVFSDVLGYTRLEYGHVKLEIAPFSLVQLLEDVAALLGIEAREQKVELRLRWPGDFVDGYRGDAEKLRTIVSNYVTNALKYAPGAPVDVEVRTTEIDADQARVWIGVRDSGPGLSAEEQSKLFRKFARGARARESGVGGTGLGLVTCRGLAELLDGSAGVTSEEGRGATFWVEVPLERTTAPAAAAPSAPAANAGASHALIVDDQEYNQVVLRGIARRLGYEAEIASHAGEVWPLIDQRGYTAVFLDWELPGLNGGEIARKLRQHPNTRDALIIATTAHDDDGIRQQCLEAQMDGFALKPFDTARIQAVLSACAAARAGRAASPTKPTACLPSAPSTESQITLSAFEDFAAGDPARAQQAVSLYLGTLDQEVAALQTAIDRNDREAVARQAHRLRSHASLVNGIALNSAAQQLMLSARNPAASDWRALCPAVLETASALKRAVISLCSRPNAGA